MFEGTGTRAKKMEASFDLKTKRLDMGGAKVTFNEIDFDERGSDTCMSWVASLRCTESGSISPLRKWAKGGGDVTSFTPSSKGLDLAWFSRANGTHKSVLGGGEGCSHPTLFIQTPLTLCEGSQKTSGPSQGVMWIQVQESRMSHRVMDVTRHKWVGTLSLPFCAAFSMQYFAMQCLQTLSFCMVCGWS